MMKNFYLVMNYGTYVKWQLLAVASGMVLGWVCKKWEEDYKEAREAGVVA